VKIPPPKNKKRAAALELDWSYGKIGNGTYHFPGRTRYIVVAIEHGEIRPRRKRIFLRLPDYGQRLLGVLHSGRNLDARILLVAHVLVDLETGHRVLLFIPFFVCCKMEACSALLFVPLFR